MRMVFLGPPGAGKGTQAGWVCSELDVPHISTGDILRRAVAAGSDLGVEAGKYMDAGDLVPDEMIVRLVVGRLAEGDCSQGFVLDGFPRTIGQAESLDGALESSGVRLDKVIYFDTSEDVIIERLTGRRICRGCGANYHVANMKPAEEGVCDKCGGELYQREDDRIETIKQRLKIYRDETEELISFYGSKGILDKVSGDLDICVLGEMLMGLFKERLVVSGNAGGAACDV